MSNMGDDSYSTYVVRLRGLPWSCTEEEVVKFFDPIDVKGGTRGVHIVNAQGGRPSGVAFVEFATREDADEAEKKHKEMMGRRYIEVFPAKIAELEWAIKREGSGPATEDECCVRLRGLPYNCSKEEICQFFSGLEIVPNGIAIESLINGRATGSAFVQFTSKEMAEKALEKHKETIGHRYIEVFPATLSQMRRVTGIGGDDSMRGDGPYMGGPGFGNRGPPPFNTGPFNGGPMSGGSSRVAPYDSRDRMGGPNRFSRGGGFGKTDFDMGGGYGGRNNRGGPRGGRLRPPAHSVHMRGLPFKATEFDIVDFFKPLEPVNVTLVTDNNGRASGEADVEFRTHSDAVKAMDKHKAHMKHRYIELFLNSSPGDDDDFRGGQGFGGGSPMMGGGMGGPGGGMMGSPMMGGPMMGSGGFGGNGGGGSMNWGQNQGMGGGGGWNNSGGNRSTLGWGTGNGGSNMGGGNGSNWGGDMGGGNIGDNMGGGGFASKCDSYVGKIKSTGRQSSWYSEDRRGGSFTGSRGGFDSPDSKKEFGSGYGSVGTSRASPFGGNKGSSYTCWNNDAGSGDSFGYQGRGSGGNYSPNY